MSMGFTKCAIVTSYEPSTQSVRTATSDLSQESEEEYKKKIYERMLGDEKLAAFEKRVKEQFKEEPAQMKLLIVVDKLLTGFDAPSATYLYIDKSMRDHDLFQAICRVNRPDGEDKDYGSGNPHAGISGRLIQSVTIIVKKCDEVLFQFFRNDVLI